MAGLDRLLAYLLLRFGAHLGQWGHSFILLFTLIRSALWQNWELRSLLEVFGTAGGTVAFWAPHNKFIWRVSADPMGQPVRQYNEFLNRFFIQLFVFQENPPINVAAAGAIGRQ